MEKMNVAMKLLTDLGVGKIPVSMTWRSESAGKSKYMPHASNREKDRRRMWATKNPHNFIQMAAWQEKSHAKPKKEVVARTSPRYDAQGAKIRRLPKNNRLTNTV